MATRYEPEYPNCPDPYSFQSGLEFQDFVATKLHDCLGITITNYSSRKWQFSDGENQQGIEIKLDRTMERTERLSIEIAEKSKATNASFVPSGIYRSDNSWLYIQGTPRRLFVFARSILVLLHKSGRYKEHTERTIKAFLLPFPEARRYAVRVLEFDSRGSLIK